MRHLSIMFVVAASISISDQAAAFDLAFVLNKRPTVTEGNNGTRVLRFEATSMTQRMPLQQPITGTLSVWGGPGSATATGGATCGGDVDFIQFRDKPFTIPAGASAPFFFDVTICGDTRRESVESVTMAIQPGTLCGTDGCLHYGNIVDDDTPGAGQPVGSKGLPKPVAKPVQIDPQRPNCRLINGDLVCS
jgi:hypothetical protein